MRNSYNLRFRTTAVVVLVLFVTSIFIADLFRIQIIQPDEYSSSVSLSKSSTTVAAVRGEILDSKGTTLAYNVASYSVYFDGSYFPKSAEKESRNKLVLRLIKLFERNHLEYNTMLPIELVGGRLVYKENSRAMKEKLFEKGYLNLNMYATPQNCFDALVDYYDLEKQSTENAIKLAGVYFAMVNADFSRSNPFTFAENVSDRVVYILKEQSRYYTGVEVRVDTSREYYDGKIAPHIIGYYDAIDAAEYERQSAKYEEQMADESLTDEEKEVIRLKSYGMTDKIGKFGIENAMEEYLRGTRGVSTTAITADGKKTTSVTREPENGNNVILTFDADYQKKVQKILNTRVERTKGNYSTTAAGSVVVLDVNDFSVLACATYPTFDLSTYKENVVELNTDPASPLWNRALRSTYAPGSTVKPAVAIGGLEEGVVTPDTPITCTVLYKYFPDQTFQCFNNYGHGGSAQYVDTAIMNSCNVYFYEVGRRLGIDRLSNYFRKFGLGEKTGVELTEATGVVAGPEEREAAGGTWYPGDVVQAAIGQSDNLFTPIQLATYVATLANGGTKYKAHFVKAIKSSDYTETIYEAEPTVIRELDLSNESKATVKKGMIALSQKFTPFTELSYPIACKTGTAQIKKKVSGVTVEYTNGFMIAYAPANNPQIAVAIAIENAKSSGLAEYVAEICDAYFENESEIAAAQTSNSILP